MNKIGFDIISDLNLTQLNSFNWENKATSLYCIIAGNISSDLVTIEKTLEHLSNQYMGVFYIAGPKEFEGVTDLQGRITKITKICRKLRKVSFLYNHVVVIDGIAILGCNGWFCEPKMQDDTIEEIELQRMSDLFYLKSSVERLQTHLDITKILMVTSSVPNKYLYFGQNPATIEDLFELSEILQFDSENKIENWIFGGYTNVVDTTHCGINYVNNPYINNQPYWAKRIAISS